MTRNSSSSPPGISRGIFSKTRGRVSSSLRHGIWTTTFTIASDTLVLDGGCDTWHDLVEHGIVRVCRPEAELLGCVTGTFRHHTRIPPVTSWQRRRPVHCPIESPSDPDGERSVFAEH